MFEKWKIQFLHRQYLKRSQKDFFLPQTYSFERVMQNVRRWVDFARQDHPRRDAIPLLDFLICTVKEDLRTSAAAELLYAADHEYRDWRRALFPFWLEDIPKEIVPFSGNTVISSIWAWDRISRAAYDIRHEGFHADWNYFSGAYYPELHLIVMDNGLHHSCAAATFQENGEIKLDVYSLQRLFPLVKTDGKFWYSKDRPDMTQPVLDVRMAILFELARMKYDLENAK
ncbi:hypothetical protein QVN85_12580 [Oscillibacter valericigenes]|jgi:hypothetical protein|nr:hypothetical protein [Oscillibacter valericigenes]